jgi:hypothetical protein
LRLERFLRARGGADEADRVAYMFKVHLTMLVTVLAAVWFPVLLWSLTATALTATLAATFIEAASTPPS